MATLNLEIDSTSLTNDYISQKTEVLDRIISLSVVTFGVFLFMGSFTLKGHYMTVCLMLMALGVGASVYGLFRYLSGSAENVNRPTGNAIEEHHLYFGRYRKETLRSIINADGIPDCVKPTGKYDGVIRLDIVLSEGDCFAGLQLMEYESDGFQPVTEMHYHTGSEVERIKGLLESYNSI